MGIKAKVQEVKPLVDAGMYMARCYEIIHLGETYDERYSKMKDSIRITWELPTELLKFGDDEELKPVVVSKLYNLNMFKLSTLRLEIESWLSRKLSEEEAENFEFLDLLGKSCMLNIVHSDDGKYANVATVNSMPKGSPEPTPYNEAIAFDFEENFDENVKDRYPEFIHKRIMESTQWKERINQLESEDYQKKIMQAAKDSSLI